MRAGGGAAQARQLVITDSQPAAGARGRRGIDGQGRLGLSFRSLTSTICLCQALFIALACRLELNIEETKETGGYDD